MSTLAGMFTHRPVITVTRARVHAYNRQTPEHSCKPLGIKAVRGAIPAGWGRGTGRR